MIKYLELTAPDTSEFRQAKILSVEVAEGDQIDIGTPLFIVKSGESEIPLPATLAGTIIEVIAIVGENISFMTPLVLLETEVEGSTATPPIIDQETPADDTSDRPKTKKTRKKKNKKEKKRTNKKHEQQSLDLSVNDAAKTNPEDSPRQSEPESAVDESNEPIKSRNMNSIDLSVPDIGGDQAKVIEILVKVGDTISVDDALITLESDKASMEVPSTHAGVVTAIAVNIDQDVEEGTVILSLSSDDDQPGETGQDKTAPVSQSEQVIETQAADATASSTGVIEVAIPDIGGDSAKVIEILATIGQQIQIEDPLITLESDKASMDVPSPVDGVIESIEVQIDQEVNEGTVIAKVLSQSDASEPPPAAEKAEPAARAPAPVASVESVATAATPAKAGKSHASPSIRRFARELGVDLRNIAGTGRKGRISKGDVKQFVKRILSDGARPATASTADSGSGIPPIPAVDFSKFGDIDIQPLNRIKRLTATNLHRSWVNVPHVTHNDEANISDLESFRKKLNAEYASTQSGVKLSPLAFIVKAAVKSIQTYPQFNASLEPGGENLIYKKYYNIGIAVDTPNGLVVPVIKDADKKSVSEIAQEMAELAAKARDKKLRGGDMSGGCFTISSLGGIGGTDFTPIINAPEVAILGVSRSKMKPIWNGTEFEPAMMLPLSLSYDHRVIDGAEGARFTRHLAEILEDVRRLTV